MAKIAKGVEKINFTMLHDNYCYIFIEKFPKKFSPCRQFQLIFQMIAMEINLTIAMTYLQLETTLHQKPFETDFFKVIVNAKLRPSFVIC